MSKVKIRKYVNQDVKVLNELRNSKSDMIMANVNPRNLESLSMTAKWVERCAKVGGFYTVTSEEKAVGYVKLSKPNLGDFFRPEIFEIGIAIHSNYQGQQIGSKAISCIIEKYRSNIFISTILRSNPASARIFEKNGFEKIGYINNAFRINDKMDSMDFWGLNLNV